MKYVEPETVIHVAWVCRICDVGGTDIDEGEPIVCWNCKGPVTTTARMPKPIRKSSA